MALWRKLLRYSLHRRLAVRAISFLLLLNWLILTLGIPLPLPVKVAKDRSRPFPCMDSLCGCNSAESCWKSCCCHTNAEKIVWAKQYGVTPPAFVFAAAKREAELKCQSCEQHVAQKSCCHEKHHSSKCDAHAAEDSGHAQTATQRPDAVEEEESTTAFVVISNLHRCHGSKIHLLVDLPALPPANPTPSKISLPGEWLSLLNESPLEGYFSPSVPPPWASV